MVNIFLDYSNTLPLKLSWLHSSRKPVLCTLECQWTFEPYHPEKGWLFIAQNKKKIYGPVGAITSQKLMTLKVMHSDMLMFSYSDNLPEVRPLED